MIVETHPARRGGVVIWAQDFYEFGNIPVAGVGQT
jgi:hypothetical protein